jgi:hypothetical protein
MILENILDCWEKKLDSATLSRSDQTHAGIWKCAENRMKVGSGFARKLPSHKQSVFQVSGIIFCADAFCPWQGYMLNVYTWHEAYFDVPFWFPNRQAEETVETDGYQDVGTGSALHWWGIEESLKIKRACWLLSTVNKP